MRYFLVVVLAMQMAFAADREYSAHLDKAVALVLEVSPTVLNAKILVGLEEKKPVWEIDTSVRGNYSSKETMQEADALNYGAGVQFKMPLFSEEKAIDVAQSLKAYYAAMDSVKDPFLREVEEMEALYVVIQTIRNKFKNGVIFFKAVEYNYKRGAVSFGDFKNSLETAQGYSDEEYIARHSFNSRFVRVITQFSAHQKATTDLIVLPPITEKDVVAQRNQIGVEVMAHIEWAHGALLQLPEFKPDVFQPAVKSTKPAPASAPTPAP